MEEWIYFYTFILHGWYCAQRSVYLIIPFYNIVNIASRASHYYCVSIVRYTIKCHAHSHTSTTNEWIIY